LDDREKKKIVYEMMEKVGLTPAEELYKDIHMNLAVDKDKEQ